MLSSVHGIESSLDKFLYKEKVFRAKMKPVLSLNPLYSNKSETPIYSVFFKKVLVKTLISNDNYYQYIWEDNCEGNKAG